MDLNKISSNWFKNITKKNIFTINKKYRKLEIFEINKIKQSIILSNKTRIKKPNLKFLQI